MLVLIGVTPAVDAQLTSKNQPHLLASQPFSSPCVKGKGTLGSVTLCITNPQDNNTVSGLVTVEAVLSGQTPDLRRAKLMFELNGEVVLTDYLAPYIFVLPTDHFPNGVKTLSVVAELNDGTVTHAATINLQINNDTSSVSDQAAGFTPYTAPPPPTGPTLYGRSGR
ncbi:MAG: Ig-like domain-containing protein [Anaerolineae bacterium]|nr:Ig-like domain-containing protein [Anaerolineae bacterium]